MLARQKRFSALNKALRWKLASFETGEKIQAIGQKYGFELLRLANITRLIREYYFGEVKFEDFPKEIEKRMGVSLFTAQEITRYIKKEIIDWDPWAEYLEKLPKASTREILTKFPKVAEQEITEGYLEFRDKPDEVFDPTIRNWLRDYVLHLGHEQHSNIQRMNYLFHTENTKNLTSTEREKLSIILKSFDENIPLPVDPKNNEVMFDIPEKPTTPEKPFPPGGVMTERPVFKDQQAPFNNQAFPSQSNIRAPQGQALDNSSRLSFTQPQKSASESFIKPFLPLSRLAGNTTDGSTPTLKTQTSSQLIDQISTSPSQRDTRIPKNQAFLNSDTLKFSNPFPTPETHEMKTAETEMVGKTPVKFKGFSKGIPKNNQGSAPPANQVSTFSSVSPADLSRSGFSPPKPSTLSYSKNIIRPHHRAEKEEKPEPKIEGNIVDLSGGDK